MKYQLIMARSLPEEVTQGTLEGDIVRAISHSSRLQSTADCKLRAYIAHRRSSSGCYKIIRFDRYFYDSEMGRFYRHVLIEKNFPHHGAVAFGKHGKSII